MGLDSSAFCACCTPASPATPVDVFNRPGLSQISYRVGTFATFREAMLEGIGNQAALANLTTRESTDYAITLIELFAAMGDVLTFYNERIANEAYLRTARERDSLLRLTALIGYRLRPGLAAQTFLSFVLDAGAETRIRKGLKVMSVPGQDEKPQIFETVEQIEAQAGINDVPAFALPALFNGFALGHGGGPVVSRPSKLAAGDKLIFFGLDAIEQKIVVALRSRADGEAISFEPVIQIGTWYPDVARVARLDGRLRFFGHNMPDTVNVYVPAPVLGGWPKWEARTVDVSLAADTTAYPLDGRYTDIAAGTQLLVDAGPAVAGASASPRLRTASVVKTEDRPAKPGNIDQLSDIVTHLYLRQTIGQPSVVSVANGFHAAYARSGSGAVLSLDPPGASPRRWRYQNLDSVSSDVKSAAVNHSRQDIFVRDQALRLRQQVLTGGEWGNWIDHGGILTSEPRPLVDSGGVVRVFARRDDFGLWVLDASAGAPGSWSSLSGVLTSAPAPVSAGSGQLAVFVRGYDRGLSYRRWNGASWSGWQNLKGMLATGPAAASTGSGRIDVAALDDAGALKHLHFDGAEWSHWHNLGGTLDGELAMVAGTPDRIDILATGKDGQLWTIAREGSAWTDWAALGGKLTSAPSAVRDSQGLHVYARGSDGAIVYRALTGGTWSAWTSLGDGVGAIDPRKTAIYCLSADDIVFRNYDYPASVSDGRIALRLSGNTNGFSKLVKGRKILISSRGSNHMASVQAATPVAATPGQVPDHLLVDFTPALPQPLEDARLAGNIASASHGETQPDDALGHGDASKPFQQLKLSRPDLTYLQSTGKIEGTPALEIRVNGELWGEVSSFYGRKASERVYTARQKDNGETFITFGDGQTGARVASGAMNVMARYRKGLGLPGTMKAGQLSIPLERPPGLRAVSNPLPADGAADPETRDGARAAAPNTVRSFGRAVSLADFEGVTTASGLAARAYVTWVWHELERAVHISVIGPGGAKLSTASLSILHAALDTARDINRPMFLANIVRVPVVVSAKLLRNPAYEAAAVLEAARAKLLVLFSFESMALGEAVFASAVYAALQSAAGVVAADLDVFQLKNYSDLTPVERAIRAVDAGPLQPHIRMYPARSTPPAPLIDRFARAGFEGSPPPVLAAEQAYIETPATDIALTVVETL